MYSRITSFIRDAFGNPEGLVPLHAPVFNGHEKDYLAECIDSTYVSSVGRFVDRFEEMTAEFTGAKKAVVCVNGTAALHMALLLAGVKQGDEVITQPLTFVSTVNAIAYCGAEPVFLDVDRDTMGLSPSRVREWLCANARRGEEGCVNVHTGRVIRACMPMHTFGHPAHLDELAALCDDYGIALIEDAAESLGSYYHGRHTGITGRIGVLSFNGNKIITTGGGGMLLFMDEQLAALAKHLTTQAKLPHPWEYVHDGIGYNYRMPNINAALGCAQMERLDGLIRSKRELAAQYGGFFRSIGVDFVTEPEGCSSNYWLNTILLDDLEQRNAFLEYSNAHGVMTRPVWRLANTLPMYRHCQCGDLSQARWFEERAVNIPSSAR